MLAEKHFNETEDILRLIPKDKVASWFLNEGFYPEQNILPPSFRVKNFVLKEAFIGDLNNIKTKRSLENLSYPLSLLKSRNFAIQHPKYYHDIIFHIIKEWDFVLGHIFNKSNKFYSYSLPIPISKNIKSGLSNLRSGRMIYEWIEMAEKHLVIDAVNYSHILRTDITNFYASVYTHSIGWALHGRETAYKDKSYELLGNKIDRLIQYSNEARTNGIPIGSALSDFIAEMLLVAIDRKISEEIKGIEFLGVRFKDDYRILCNSPKDANKILQTIASCHSDYNLSINESKTKITELPDGLYRIHNRQYFHYSLREKKHITFKLFEYTLLEALDIHKRIPGTSILDKFLSELFTSGKERKLKIVFSRFKQERKKEIRKAISLLFLTKRSSDKILCHILAIVEQLFIKYKKEDPELKAHLKVILLKEINIASERESAFQIIWFIFFSKYIGLGLTKEHFTCKALETNNLYKTILESKQKIFNDSQIDLFRTPKNCRDIKSLADYLNIFPSH